MNWKSAAATAREAHPLARSKAWLRRYVKENGRLTLLSLGVAFLFFVVSRQPNRAITVVGVPLEFTNIPAGLEISSVVPAAVNVRLHGPRDLVQEITATELEVKADLGNKAAGERVIQLKATDILRPKKVEIQRIEPAAIELTLEATHHKTVPVEIQFIGVVAEGFERSQTHLEPATVEIEGPASRVAQVTKILTESISLDGRRASLQASVDLEPGKSGVRIVQGTPIRIWVEITAKRISSGKPDVDKRAATP